MYHHVDDPEFDLLTTKKEADLEPLFPWTEPAATPFDFPSAGGYSYESFPREVPIGYTLYTEPARRVDAFGFPTELQMQNPPVEEKDSVSAELSSNRTTTIAPSTAQIKNRRAQKKFRERQKAKMTNLAEEVESLRKRVENLSCENRDLENSNMLLSKVIQMRDRQMGDLRTVLMHNADQQHCASKYPCKQLPASKDNDEGTTHKRWEISHRLRDDHNPMKFLNVQHSALRNTWKQYVEMLTERLVLFEADPTNTALRDEIRKVHDELGEISLKCATLSPSSMCTLVASGDAYHDPPSDPKESEKFWLRVLASLKLTPNQERLLLDRRQHFMQHLQSVWKKRSILSQKLQGYVETKNETLKSNVWSCRGGTGVRQVLEELKDASCADSQQHTDFIGSFFFSILDEIQGARAYVESYPFYPDVLQMANLLYKKHHGTEGDLSEDKSQSTSIPSEFSLQN